VGKHRGIAIVIVFADGQKGEEAAEKLAEEPSDLGGEHLVSTSHEGHVVLSLAHHPAAGEIALAEKCSETKAEN
jgi:hypothetical protein